jgi:DNA polymerase-3 subunit chi
MTKIDFYTGCSDKLRTACQLSQKAIQQSVHTVISLPDRASCDALDRLMWHYPETAFIPHTRSNAADADRYPVILSHDGDNFKHYALLISLHQEVLPFFSRFDRLIEIIGSNNKDQQEGRARFKFYRDQGYELRHFDLSGGRSS